MDEATEAKARFERFTAEHDGNARLILFRAEEDREFAERARRGDPEAVEIVMSTAAALHRMKEQPDLECVACSRRFGGALPGAFMLVLPGHRPSKQAAMAAAQPVCQQCSRTKSNDEILQATLRTLHTIFDKVIVEERDDG